jgi:transcriptional regulator with XRE-family HTH domain
MVRTTPTLQRWALARRLRELREAAGLGIEDVARELLCTPSKISRIETAARGASLRDVRDLCRIYQVDAATQDNLMDLSRDAKARGWWQHFDEILPEYATYVGFEEAATTIQTYETITLPGLLQTADYTRALMPRVNMGSSLEATEQYVASRRQRQERLYGDERPSLWVILDEAVLHRQVGGAKVMHEQIEHLMELVAERRVTLQIIPFSAGAHASMEGSFTMLRFEGSDMPELVYVEGRAGHLFLSRDADVKRFRDTLDHLRARAVDPDDSLELMRDLVTELT